MNVNGHFMSKDGTGLTLQYVCYSYSMVTQNQVQFHCKKINFVKAKSNYFKNQVMVHGLMISSLKEGLELYRNSFTFVTALYLIHILDKVYTQNIN